MSEKRMKMRQRRQAYRRLHGEKKAVSPVVATLILILIAVAAAAALYLWLVVWQGNLTKGIGQPGAQSTLTIGGSTSVYPFSSLAVTWFEQNNSDVVITDNQGGTGAGMVAVCAGNIDLGASSTPQTVSTLETSYGCSSTYSSTIQIDTIAYDAVDVVINSANDHGLLSVSADTLNAIYEAGSGTPYTGAYIGTIDGVASPVAVAAGSPLTWEEIPAMTSLGSAAFSDAAHANVVLSESTASSIGAGTPCNQATTYTAATAADICDAGLMAAATETGTPCGFAVCAGGVVAAPATDPIVPVERSDASGTTQTFEAKLLGYGSGASSSASSWVGASPSTAAQDSNNFANLGYAGCGSNNLLSDCGFTYGTSQQGNGNPGVLAIVASNLNAIGYASDGLARTTANIGIVPFLGLGEGVSSGVVVGPGGAGIPSGVSSSQYKFGGIVPTTGTTGSIAAGLTNSALYGQYVGGRPFQLVSLEPLTGVAQEFLNFIDQPAVNAALASATFEVGLYSVIP